MNQPIGISFLPSQENAAQGMQRGAMEGDLGQALKILSLRLPRVMGARAITPTSNLGAPGQSGDSQSAVQGLTMAAGAGGESGRYNPNAALFQALISAMMGGGSIGGFDAGQSGKTTGAGAGTVNPYIKFIGDGEIPPGTYDPITTESEPVYRKPETQWGGIGRGGELPPVPGDAQTYGRIPRKYDPTMSFPTIP